MRSRTIWNQVEKNAAKEFLSQTNFNSNTCMNEDDMIFHGLHFDGDDPLPPNQHTAVRNDIQYSRDLHNALQNVFPITSTDIPSALMEALPPLSFHEPHLITNTKRAICQVTSSDITRQMEKNAKLCSITKDKPTTDQPQHLSDFIDSQLDQHTISTQQRKVIDTVRSHLERLGPHFNRSDRPPKPMHLLVTGMPGTGKSFVIDRVCEVANWLESGHVATMAYNGIAAVNIDGGTLCSMLSIPVKKDGDSKIPPLSATRCALISKALQIDKLSLVIIDEISNVNASMLHAISTRLQELTGNRSKPFGGLSILCFGDFSQLPPVKSTSITHTLMMVSSLDQQSDETQRSQKRTSHSSSTISPRSKNKSNKRTFAQIRDEGHQIKKQKTLNKHGKYRSTSSARLGADLFAGFTRIHLAEQHRAQDEQHLQLLQSMSKGKEIPLSMIRNYKTITDTDVTEDSSWAFAPVLVANNRERIDIVHHKTTLFAQKNSSHAFRWRTDVVRWQGKPVLSQEQIHIQDKDPCFWQKFVPGADAFLTTNLNTNLGLANGTPIKLHSLTFTTREQLMAVRSQIRSLPPGSVVTLDEPPLSVNIEILSTFDSKTTPSAKKIAQIDILKKHSIVKGETIIPIPIMRTHCKTHAFSVHSTSGISKAHTRELFPFEMSFAMTVHKAQGRTIPKVVLALSHRDNTHSQMSYASIYVALSRVKHRDNLRILMHNSGPRPGILALKYITHLKHCIHVLDYYSGFPEKTQSGKWNSAKSLRAKQSRSALRH